MEQIEKTISYDDNSSVLRWVSSLQSRYPQETSGINSLNISKVINDASKLEPILVSGTEYKPENRFPITKSQVGNNFRIMLPVSIYGNYMSVVILCGIS